MRKSETYQKHFLERIAFELLLREAGRMKDLH